MSMKWLKWSRTQPHGFAVSATTPIVRADTHTETGRSPGGAYPERSTGNRRKDSIFYTAIPVREKQ